MHEGRKSFLLVPAGGNGEGVGHLMRCLSLAEKLSGNCTLLTASLSEDARAILRNREVSGGYIPPRVDALSDGDRFDIVLLDKRRTTSGEEAFFSRFGTVVCLDEGGEARRRASYLIAALPAPPAAVSDNIASLAFLDLPPRRRKVELPIRRILVSFGGEDSSDLSGAFLDAVLSRGIFPAEAITVVEGPLFGRKIWPQGVKVVQGAWRLTDLLCEHDLVVTHFGMTALEALALGVPVALLSPTRYHGSLSSVIQAPTIGVGKPDMGAMRSLLGRQRTLVEAVERFQLRLQAERGTSLAGYLSRLSAGSGRRCPVCRSDGNNVIARFAERTYRACPACRLTYLESFAAESPRYDGEYFGEEYRRRYGRTYLEDFPSIKETGKARMRVLRRLLGGDALGTLLDIGCAFGPFLDAARESGFSPFGVDVSEEAVAYVRRRLGIPALCGSFEELRMDDLPPGPIRAVTLWYVIEHFQDLGGCLKKAASLLQPGGVLAFSTPNGRGISARKDMREFLLKSPADHYSILSPRGLSRILARFGFDLAFVRVTGHHPERFPSPLGGLATRGGALAGVLAAVSGILGLGDTFEAYAVKRNAA